MNSSLWLVGNVKSFFFFIFYFLRWSDIKALLLMLVLLFEII